MRNFGLRYALPLQEYKTTDPLIEWLHRHYKYQVHSGKTLQSVFSQSCGDCALMFLVLKARGASMQDFLRLFSSEDFVSNARKVGGWLRGRVVDQLACNNLNLPIKPLPNVVYANSCYKSEVEIIFFYYQTVLSWKEGKHLRLKL